MIINIICRLYRSDYKDKLLNNQTLLTYSSCKGVFKGVFHIDCKESYSA
jgi:hypothetical protein